jgi:hypothetical protein
VDIYSVTNRVLLPPASQVVCYVIKYKNKAVPLPPCRRQGWKEIQVLHIDLGTKWGEWSASPSAALCPRERTPLSIGQEAGWTSELVCTQRVVEKSVACAGNRTSIVQSVIRYYIDWATPAPGIFCHVGEDDSNRPELFMPIKLLILVRGSSVLETTLAASHSGDFVILFRR